MTTLTHGLTGTELSIAKAAQRLMGLRENTVNPHARLVAAIDRLIDKRCEDPLAGIPVVTTDEVFALVDLPDTGRRPRSLVDRYGDSGATYRRAMDRLAGAGLRRGYHPTA